MSLEFFQKVQAAGRAMRDAFRRQPKSDFAQSPDWADDAPPLAPHSQMRAPSEEQLYDPEEYTKQILAYDKDNPPMSPQRFMDMVGKGEARVDRGYIYQARQDRKGRLMRESYRAANGKTVKNFRIKPIRGHAEFMAEVERARETQRLREDGFGSGGFGSGDFGGDGGTNGNTANLFGPFDPGQYTEYAPLLGGYFFAQQYLQDMLKGFAYAFEAWNHNPLAHRIINALAQYTMGRRFTWSVDDERKEKAWEDFAAKINLRQRMSKFWVREKLMFGEQLLDKAKWRTLHPATVWDIITDPDDYSNVYYYYRSYPTAYQMFTGYKGSGVPGADKVKAQDYVIEQLPYTQIIHTKSQCTSFEKRGRSTLFPILGWLKRIKDIYNNQAIREQMMADYVWDVEIDGGPGDVSKYAAQYTPLARPGSTHFHNKAVKRTPMAVPAGSNAQSEASNNILAFIATAIGLPKDFFNVISASGGNRATALVAAEPFTKVVEDEQADQEFLLHQMAKAVFEKAGLDYSPDDIEFTFPSVTKDTTSETVKNIIIGESQGYISKERAATLFTQEMNITAYDFESEQQDIKNEKAEGISNQGMPPSMGGLGPDGQVGDGESPIHGDGKVDTQDQMGTL